MASGPQGTGWNQLVADLGAQFGDRNKRKQLADDFKLKHGKKGDGKDPNTTPYKFGRYVDKGTLLSSENQKAQFSMDAGTRHWDGSLKLLEYAIRACLTLDPDPKEIIFKPPQEDTGASKAKAMIKNAANVELLTVKAIDDAIAAPGALTIEVVCPRANLRPPPP
jgi:hypothetical protein